MKIDDYLNRVSQNMLDINKKHFQYKSYLMELKEHPFLFFTRFYEEKKLIPCDISTYDETIFNCLLKEITGQISVFEKVETVATGLYDFKVCINDVCLLSVDISKKVFKKHLNQPRKENYNPHQSIRDIKDYENKIKTVDLYFQKKSLPNFLKLVARFSNGDFCSFIDNALSLLLNERLVKINLERMKKSYSEYFKEIEDKKTSYERDFENFMKYSETADRICSYFENIGYASK